MKLLVYLHQVLLWFRSVDERKRAACVSTALFAVQLQGCTLRQHRLCVPVLFLLPVCLLFDGCLDGTAAPHLGPAGRLHASSYTRRHFHSAIYKAGCLLRSSVSWLCISESLSGRGRRKGGGGRKPRWILA